MNKKEYTCKKCNFKGTEEYFRTPHKKGKDRHDYYDYCKECHCEASRINRYKNLYNITVDEYEKILSFQNNKCAICGRPAKSNQNRLAVDHDHKTGLIRGLLCWSCNKAIGCFKDNQHLIWASFLYLFAPPAPGALGEKRYGIVGRIGRKAKYRVLGGPEREEDQYRIDPNKLKGYLEYWSKKQNEVGELDSKEKK